MQCTSSADYVGAFTESFVFEEHNRIDNANYIETASDNKALCAANRAALLAICSMSSITGQSWTTQRKPNGLGRPLGEWLRLCDPSRPSFF